MILAILIPTLPERRNYFINMVTNLNSQIAECEQADDIIIMTDDRPKPITTGEKRNDLLSRAMNVNAKYGWFVDDDDHIQQGAVKLLMEAFKKDPDVVGINGWMTTDGKNRVDWEIRLGHPYKAVERNGKEYYLRHPNHITPMKLAHAIKVKFPHKVHGEDYDWAKDMNDRKILQTQEIIETPIYHYQFRTK